MRGDGVGVGHIGEVQSGAGRAGIEAGGGDGRGAIGERDTGVVDGRAGGERDGGDQPAGIGSSIGDGTRGEHGACDVHWEGSGGPHRMRGHRVGVGDVGEVSGRTRGTGDSASGDDGGGARRKRDPGLVGGNRVAERDASGE